MCAGFYAYAAELEREHAEAQLPDLRLCSVGEDCRCERCRPDIGAWRRSGARAMARCCTARFPTIHQTFDYQQMGKISLLFFIGYL